MSEIFKRTLHVRWADMDYNAHMRNTAYLEMASDVRMMYFASRGLTMDEFERLRTGPVVMRDTIEYFRELRLLEPVTVTLALEGLSRDGSRFRLRNEFLGKDGRLAARVTSVGGWLDLENRRLVSPPEKLAAPMQELARTEGFEEMPSA
jgi:acyl-CoA thioester hydrolase